MKKNRKAKVFYTLKNQAGNDVQIDLNNYKVTCVVTGARKSFYHKYLAGLIERDYQNNIDLFRMTYKSRAAAPSKKERELERVKSRIDRLYNQIRELKTKRDQLTTS